MESQTKHVLLGLIVAFFAVSGFLGYSWYTLNQKHAELSGLFNETQADLREKISLLEDDLASTSRELANAREENRELSEDLEREEEKNEEFEDQIRDITGTVGKLDKLSKTDPELLQKYSKVFFLNEHYQPDRLVAVDKEYLYDENEPEFLHIEVMPFFEEMVEDALDDDINLWVISGFRSFDEQESLKGQYLVTYGSGANTFSADQGYSEHQLGTTIDFTTNGINGGLQGFEATEAYVWLTENAHKYGFTLSYPKDNGYYIFEPWHWRFVGEELARDLHSDRKHFYDLDQREIDEYLISLFD